MYTYCEIIRGGPDKRGRILSIPIPNYNLDYYGKNEVDCYHSVFMQTEDFVKYDNNGSKVGYDGNVYCEYLFWDMDNIIESEVKSDTIELVERLYAYEKGNIRIYYSGNKGYHIYYLCPELKDYVNHPDFNDVVKSACSLLACDLKSWDRRIYDKTRIIRTTNSIHAKTNLYKIPITFEELKNGDIKKLASEQRQFKYNQPILNEDMMSLLINAEKGKDDVSIKGGIFSGSDLYDGIINGFNYGNRNNGLASVAGLLHSRNIDDNFIYAMLSSINKNGSDPLSDNELNTIVNSISRYSVDKKYIEVKDDDIVDIKQAGESWENIITNCGYTSFGERFKHINDRMKLCIPGDTIAFVASSGVGKSTMGLELGNEEAKQQNKKSLFGSMEMSRGGVFFRAATIESYDLSVDGYVPSSEVATVLLKDENDLKARVYEQWKNLLIIDKGGLPLEKIIEYYKKAQDLTKGNVSNLVIDYFQNLDNVQQIDVFMDTARRLKDVAKELETKMIVLLQTNKTLPDDFTEPTKNHIEGAGAVFHAMDYIITAWKSRDDKMRLHSKFLKDRWGASNYYFDLVREGLKYHTEDYIAESPFQGGL